MPAPYESDLILRCWRRDTEAVKVLRRERHTGPPSRFVLFTCINNCSPGSKWLFADAGGRSSFGLFKRSLWSKIRCWSNPFFWVEKLRWRITVIFHITVRITLIFLIFQSRKKWVSWICDSSLHRINPLTTSSLFLFLDFYRYLKFSKTFPHPE